MTTAFLQAATSERASALEIDAMSRRGFSLRLAFALLAALAASLVAPLVWLAYWLAVVLVWELWLAQFLTNTFVWSVFERDAKLASVRQTGIVALGACLFGAFPFLAWTIGTTLGAVLAVAWIGGTAIHVFVYLSNHRPLLIAGLIPPLAAAFVLPAMKLGVSLEALSASFATLYLIFAAAAFAFDRNVLLVNITTEKAARETAEAVACAKSQFLSAVTHELRTPINHIVGYAGLLEDDIRAGSADSNDASNIAVAGQNLLSLVNRVIEISKLEAGQIELDPYDIKIGMLLGEAAEQIAPAAAKTGNRVVVEPELADAVLHIDGARALACLHCLSENAAKFCANGVITFSARHIGEAVEITVSDTGAGLSEIALVRLAEPMTQSDGSTTRTHDGLGLGLSLARALATALGGTVTIESVVGRGTSASLRLPARRHA